MNAPQQPNEQQRTFSDILLELMVQNETLDKIQTSALKLVDLITPIPELLNRGIEAVVASKSEETTSLGGGGKEGKKDDPSKVLTGIHLTLMSLKDVAKQNLDTLKSIEAGMVMAYDLGSASRDILSNLSNDFAAFYNAFVDNNNKNDERERIRALQEKERNKEMADLLDRLGTKKEEPKGGLTPPKEDGFFAKILGPLGMIAGLLTGFVVGVVAYFGKMFKGILSGLSNLLNLPKILERIGLGEKFLEKFMRPFRAIKEGISNFFTSTIGKLGELFGEGGALSSVGKLFTRLKDFVMKFIEPFTTKFTKFFGIGKALGAIFGKLMVVWDVFMSVKKAVDKFGETGDITQAIGTGINELLGRLIGAPLDILKSTVSWILGKLGFDEAEKFLDSFSFTDLIQEFVGRLVAWGRQTFELAFQTVVDIWDDISKAFSGGSAMDKFAAIFRGFYRYLLALPMDIMKNAIANVAEWFGADMSDVRKFSFRKLLGGTNTAVEAETAPSSGKSIIAAAGETTAAKKLAEQKAKAGEKAVEETLNGDKKDEGIWGLLKEAEKAFYDALQQNMEGGKVQPEIGALPSTRGSEISALVSNTADLESNAEVAAAAAPVSGPKSNRSSNISAQSVTYNNSNIPDRTSWMTTPLANWSL